MWKLVRKSEDVFSYDKAHTVIDEVSHLSNITVMPHDTIQVTQ